FLLQAQRGDVDPVLASELSLEAAEEEEDEESAPADDFVARERERVGRLRASRISRELDYLQDYIVDLDAIQHDSKFAAFAQRLETLLAYGNRVIVFT